MTDARRSTIESLIKSSQTGKDTKVYWDVLMSQDGKTYRVRDVGLDLGGSVLWLAQEQQAQFESFLDRNNGKIDKLIERINRMLADMDAAQEGRPRLGLQSQRAESDTRTPNRPTRRSAHCQQSRGNTTPHSRRAKRASGRVSRDQEPLPSRCQAQHDRNLICSLHCGYRPRVRHCVMALSGWSEHHRPQGSR